MMINDNIYLWALKLERNETLHIHVQHGKLLQRVQYRSHWRQRSSWMRQMPGQKVRSTRHNAVRHDGQLGTPFYGVTSWPCDELTGSLSVNRLLKIDLSVHSFSEPFVENRILCQHFQWIHSLKTDSSAQSFSESFTEKLLQCCRNNETRASIAKPPNSAQLEGTPYHSPNLHLGPCSSVAMRPRTNTQT